jgi:hypothetical protein
VLHLFNIKNVLTLEVLGTLEILPIVLPICSLGFARNLALPVFILTSMMKSD